MTEVVARVWEAIEYPLSVQELRRLGWLSAKIDATVFLGDRGQYVNSMQAKRLAFARWLVRTGRVSG